MPAPTLQHLLETIAALPEPERTELLARLRDIYGQPAPGPGPLEGQGRPHAGPARRGPRRSARLRPLPARSATARALGARIGPLGTHDGAGASAAKSLQKNDRQGWQSQPCLSFFR